MTKIIWQEGVFGDWRIAIYKFQACFSESAKILWLNLSKRYACL